MWARHNTWSAAWARVASVCLNLFRTQNRRALSSTARSTSSAVAGLESPLVAERDRFSTCVDEGPLEPAPGLAPSTRAQLQLASSFSSAPAQLQLSSSFSSTPAPAQLSSSSTPAQLQLQLNSSSSSAQLQLNSSSAPAPPQPSGAAIAGPRLQSATVPRVHSVVGGVLFLAVALVPGPLVPGPPTTRSTLTFPSLVPGFNSLKRAELLCILT